MITVNAFEDAVLRRALRNSMNDIPSFDTLFQYVRDLHLPAGDYAIFGSGPMIVRGIISGANDLDIVCRGEAWKMACATGNVSYDERHDISLASHLNGRVTFGTRWTIGEVDVDDLIATAEMIEDLPFVRMQYVVAYKILRASAKDLLHIEQYRRATRS